MCIAGVRASAEPNHRACKQHQADRREHLHVQPGLSAECETENAETEEARVLDGRWTERLLMKRANVDRQIAADGDMAGHRRALRVVDIERWDIEGALGILRQRGVIAVKLRSQLGRVAFEWSNGQRALYRCAGFRRDARWSSSNQRTRWNDLNRRGR